MYHDSGGTWEAKSHTVRNFNRLNTSVFRESISFIFGSIESFLNKFHKQLSSLEIHVFINLNKCGDEVQRSVIKPRTVRATVSSELTQQDGTRKEDGKPCVTSVTIILFETTFRQTSLSFK